MNNAQVVIRCPGCPEEHRIAYPHPEEIRKIQLQEIRENHLLEPTAASRTNFLCQRCGLVFLYKAADIRFEAVQVPDEDRIPGGMLGYRIALRCAHEGCEAFVVFHTITNAETGNDELGFRTKSKMKGTASCQLGHQVTLKNANIELMISPVDGFEIVNAAWKNSIELEDWQDIMQADLPGATVQPPQ